MSRKEWLEACAARFKHYGCTYREAMYMAEICLDDMCEGDLTYDPVEAADEDVSYW